MTSLRFDEINNLVTNSTVRIRSTPYEQYFGKMHISDERKQRRVDIARKLQPTFQYLFYLIEATIQYDFLDYEFVIEQFEIELRTVLEQLVIVDAYFDGYVTYLADEIVKATYNNIDEVDPDDYWLSEDRAIFISENEANTIANYEELQEALEDGYLFKTWVTMGDMRVRKDHDEVNGETIPIGEYFEVGGSQMLFPHDVENAPEQTVNCRCSLDFS